MQVAYDQCNEGNTKIRFLAVRLYGTGMATSEVLSIIGCSRSSLMNWSRIYQQMGVGGLVDKRAGGNSAKLAPYQVEHLADQLERYTPEQLLGAEATSPQFWTVTDLARLVERDYDVVYDSLTSYRTLLKRCGLSRQKPAQQYKSRSELKVMDFEETLEKNARYSAGSAKHGHPGTR
ncbi:MAG: transposase [Caldilineaceae bacterium]|nr:transposase [Caldilineaceae bacterium]